MADPNPSPPTYADLTSLTSLTTQIESATTAFQNALLKTHHDARRSALISRIPHFWPLVFEQAPQDVDQYIQPSDSAIFAACLEGVEVERFKCKGGVSDFMNVLGGGAMEEAEEAFGEPRSLRFTFTFGENEWFSDRTITKSFYYRYARAESGPVDPTPWSGLVSEPVRIHWKEGKDLSEGLTDAACELWEAQAKAGLLEGGGSEEAGKKRDEASKELAEYKRVVEKVEASTEGSLSFFCWFGYRGRWVGKEEDLIARREEKERLAKGRAASANGTANAPTKEDDAAPGSSEAKENNDSASDDDSESLIPSEAAAEIFFDGPELAVALAEDVWPNALRYFTDAQMEGDDADEDDASLSSGSFDGAELEEMAMSDLDEADQNMEDIRMMTKGKGKRGMDDGEGAKKKMKA